jgi:hypothetical protein
VLARVREVRRQPVLVRPLRGEALAEHRQLERARVADRPRQAGQRVPAQRDAQLDLRDREPGVPRGDAQVAARREHRAAAHREAVHRRDRHLVEVLDRVRRPAANARFVPQLQLVIRAGLAPFARVGAGGEARPLAGEDHDARLEVVRQLQAEALEVAMHLAVDRVALLRPVHEGRQHRAVAFHAHRFVVHRLLPPADSFAVRPTRYHRAK